MRRSVLVVFTLTLLLTCHLSAHAAVKIIEGDSSYIMGDNDSKIDARRIATQEAKRKALELAGTYVESLTQVKNYQLTKDEIKSYTAGVLETEVVAEQMRGTTEHPEIFIKARCKIDTDVVLVQLDKYKENEELKEQLDASAKDYEDLRKERDTLVAQLKAEKDKSKVAATQQKLDTVLAKEESNDEANKVWINIGSQLVQIDGSGKPVKQAELDSSAVVLQKAIKVNPQNQRARTMLASIYQRNGNMTAAESELRGALRQNPNNIDLHMRLGVLLKEQGRFPSALQEFHFVERYRPHFPMMLYQTGMTFQEMKQCGRAVQYLNRFLHNPQVEKYPQKRHIALRTIEDCSGERPGRIRKLREQ
jgi:tetratricopeptide (TPR) repeat protein